MDREPRRKVALTGKSLDMEVFELDKPSFVSLDQAKSENWLIANLDVINVHLPIFDEVNEMYGLIEKPEYDSPKNIIEV